MIVPTPTATSTVTANVNDYSHNQRPTTSEQVAIRVLIDYLTKYGITCEIGVQQKLVIPLRKTNSEAIDLQLKALTKRFASSEYSIRQPDLFLPKFGLVIEVDGAVHDCSDARIKRDSTRDAEYKALKLHCFVIYNAQLYDPRKRARVFNDILSFIKLEAARSDFKKLYQRRRKAISRAREEFKSKFPSFGIGEHNPRSQAKTFCDGVTGCVQWAGHSFTVGQNARIK